MHHEELYALRKVSHGDNWVNDHHGTLLLRKVSHGENWDDNHHGTLLLSNNSGGEIGDIPITIVDLHHEIGDIHITIVDLHHGTLVTSILQWLICIMKNDMQCTDTDDVEHMTGSMLTRIINIEPVSLSSFPCWSNGERREKLVWFDVR